MLGHAGYPKLYRLPRYFDVKRSCMVMVGGSGKPQSSRMRRCSHSAVPSAVSVASA